MVLKGGIGQCIVVQGHEITVRMGDKGYLRMLHALDEVFSVFLLPLVTIAVEVNSRDRIVKT